MFIVLNKTDYYSKLQNILDDHTKFKTLHKYLIIQLKSKCDKLITANNAERNNRKLPKIIGHNKPDYLYGTIKIHNRYRYLRPIISQIPTPIYELTKAMKQLITQNLPSKYNIKSTDELNEVLHTLKPNNGLLVHLILKIYSLMYLTMKPLMLSIISTKSYPFRLLKSTLIYFKIYA